MNPTTPVSLDRAKRDLEKSVETCKTLALAIWKNSSAPQNLCPLDYFYANAANGAAFGKRVQALRKNQLISTTAEFDRAVELVYANYTNVESLAKAEKARKEAKRAAVKAKKDQREDLNLQEGVKLGGVDVGQYKVILAGLEPVRLHVLAVKVEQLRTQFNKIVETLAKHEGTCEGYYVEKKGHEVKPDNFLKWFELSGRRNYKPQFRAFPESVIADSISRLARQFALAYVQGYAVKLAGKVGEVIANEPKLSDCVVLGCSVSSTTLWQDSVAELTLEHRESIFADEVRFHTQIIWNRSCLGKVFNQYPTRRID